SADAWMDEVESLLPRVTDETDATALDIYVESIAFSNQHLARLGELAADAGLALRCHVEQFTGNRSVPVALEHGARSVDHLACLHPDDLEPLAASECAAVLLPGAEFMAAERTAPASCCTCAPTLRPDSMSEPAGRYEIPAMPNAHSHAFQRGLRAIGERPAPATAASDDFWSWREEMYRLAGSLELDSMHDAAVAAFAEMGQAGYGAVGEFHYLHHRADGTPYDDPNQMAIAVAEGAIAEGLPIVLLPAAYHRAGWDGADLEPEGAQRRFSDPDVETFLERVDRLREWAEGRAEVEVGVAAPSVRALPACWLVLLVALV